MIVKHESARQAQALIELARKAINPVVGALWAAEAAVRYDLMGYEWEAEKAYELADCLKGQMPPEDTTAYRKDGIDVILGLEQADRMEMIGEAENLFAYTLWLDGLFREMKAMYGPRVSVELRSPDGQSVSLQPNLIKAADTAISLHSQLAVILSEEEGRRDAEFNLSRLVEMRDSYA